VEKVSPANLVEFLGRAPDLRLLADDMRKLPEAEQREVPQPTGNARRLVLAAGVVLTGASLVIGAVLIALGAITALIDGLSSAKVVAMAVGGGLVATHWGWVHVAEFAGQALDAGDARRVRAEMSPWLDSIHPYTRYSVVTEVLEDGSIRIVRRRHQPVLTDGGAFSFTCEEESEEIHSGDLPAESIADRAETLRRSAALDTETQRARFELAADAYETALIAKGGEEQQLEARRAASAALSEGINRNLREPPLVE
jgi:hypothetical protein